MFRKYKNGSLILQFQFGPLNLLLLSIFHVTDLASRNISMTFKPLLLACHPSLNKPLPDSEPLQTLAPRTKVTLSGQQILVTSQEYYPANPVEGRIYIFIKRDLLEPKTQQVAAPSLKLPETGCIP